MAVVNWRNAAIIENEDIRFKHAFSRFSTSLFRFKNGFINYFSVSETHLLGKFGSTLLVVTIKDGKVIFSHLVFAIYNGQWDRCKLDAVHLVMEFNRNNLNKILNLLIEII